MHCAQSSTRSLGPPKLGDQMFYAFSGVVYGKAALVDEDSRTVSATMECVRGQLRLPSRLPGSDTRWSLKQEQAGPSALLVI